MTELHRDLGAAGRVHEVHDALPRGHMLGFIQPRTARRDPALLRNIRHLAEHEASPPDRAAAEMYEMPFIGHPVLGDILAHRRDNDAIRQQEIAEPKWREHGRTCVVRRTSYVCLLVGLVGIPVVNLLDEFRIAHLQRSEERRVGTEGRSRWRMEHSMTTKKLTSP